MGKPDIESWIASTAADGVDAEDADFDETYNDARLNNWEEARDDWPAFISQAQRCLLSSHTKSRSIFINEQLISLCKNADLSHSEALDIFKLLLPTYPRYIDQTSRDAVESVIKTLVIRKDKLSEVIIGWIRTEAGRICEKGYSKSSSAANRFVLLRWACAVYSVKVESDENFTSARAWGALLEAMALLYDSLQDESTPAKGSIRHTAVVCARRALRTSPRLVTTVVLSTLSLHKSSPASVYLISFLCLACDVAFHLKHVPEEYKTLSTSTQKDIIQLYTNSVLMSKTPLPTHVPNGFNGFIRSYITEEDFRSTILPVMEKASLRSPEVALPVMCSFFASYTPKVTDDLFRRLITIITNSCKSSNPSTRSNSIALFQVLLTHNNEESNEEHCANEIILPAMTGKTAGGDHRIALYSMLGSISPSAIISKVLLENAPYLLIKEANDQAISLLASNLVPHLAFLLRNDISPPHESILSLVKEMNGSKPALRRSVCALMGSVLYDSTDVQTEALNQFLDVVVPALEANLKAVSANPLTSPMGPLEGYVALASLLRPPIYQNPKFESVVSHSATTAILVGSAAKASFLLWEKVYQKFNTVEEETWLFRALRAALIILKNEKSEHIRLQIGSAFVHLATQSPNRAIRQETIKGIEEENIKSPRAIHAIIPLAISAHLNKLGTSSSASDEGTIRNTYSRFSSLLMACASFDDGVQPSVREELLADLVLLAHQPGVCGTASGHWIDLCQKAKTDPWELIQNQKTRLLKHVLEANAGVARASAVTTLAFVAPDAVVPPLVEQIKEDLSPSEFSSLTETDIAIWKTPEGATYVDVLSSKQSNAPERKGKNAAIEKWEAELRQSLANKHKAQAPRSLSKQEKELVDAQLRKESEIRQRVNKLYESAKKGLELVKSIVDSRAEPFAEYFSSVIGLFLEGIIKHGAALLGRDAFEGYIDLGRYCSERLGTFKTWIGVGTLRYQNEAVIPVDLKVEPLNSLVLRILYRLRSLSEQQPFDAATYCYVSSLLSSVIKTGGISGSEEEETTEQIVLIVDVVKFHSAEFGDARYPRAQTLSDVLLVIQKHPTQAKDAASALVAISEAIHLNATPGEIAVLIKGTLAQESYVRNASLQSLQALDLTDMDWCPELWVAMYDNDQQNARLARHIWEDNGLDVSENFFNDLRPYLDHENSCIRMSCALSLEEAVSQWPQTVPKIVKSLQDYYREKAKILGPEYDEYGILISRSLEETDHWPVRLAIAQSFEALAPVFSAELIEPFFDFLLTEEALGDRHTQVRSAMLNAASKVIDLHGTKQLQALITTFEKHLATASGSNETADYVKEAAVILLGRTARHLDANDPRIPGIVARLKDALKTPSEQVQVAVSECIAPLIRFIKSTTPKLVQELLRELFHAPKYGERRGAAYGLAGVIKGTGVSGIKEFDIIEHLESAMEDKKNYEPRQGAMFALETMSATLGRNFEPYIIELLPSLLASFGDASSDVREATEDAAKVIMANLSGYGIKRILPSLLSALEEKQWRTKKGAIELLGTMAYCAPKQLSMSLPTVIPRLTSVLTDSHAQVRTAANRSLKQFGEVINNPEIQHLSPTLLKALVDPAKTSGALSSLLKTSFVHYIDSPSLALLMPIIERGLRERGAETKRKAAQIVGNLASITDSQDFVPYLAKLLPLVHVVLVDPVPEARATAAKALGTLIERLGEEQFPAMVPNLLRTLKTDTSGVDRQGAAQGLSEVLAGLGMERLEALLPDIVSNAQSPRSTVREGFMSLLVYLPATFGVRFQPHLTKIVAPILSGLSDSEEYVRDAAMRAGRMIITNYSSRAIDLLLPELEHGMFDSSWRIRHSSITLVGELLFKVSGISGKAEVSEDEVEITAAESSRKALADALGKERRDRVLSALYIARQDAVSVVRQSAIHIWKALVHNTPRTVRELLPELVTQLIALLVDEDSSESQETASRTIGELCRKFGERILGEIVVILRSKISSPDNRTREGVCLAMCEIMENATETQREGYDDDIVATIRTCLVDDETNVRAAAAQAFDGLQEHLGARAIDQTIPTLLEALRQPGESSGTALQALKEVMNVRANSVFPVLIPTLISSPMTVFNAHALASLVTVAGNALSKRLTQVLGALVDYREKTTDGELSDAIDEAIKALLGSISDVEGLNTLMLLLLGWLKAANPTRRASACKLFGSFCEVSDLDDSLYRVDWVRQLVSLLDDSEVIVHTAAWQAFDAFVKSIPKDELEPLVVPLRRTIESTGAPGRYVPGFSLPKGISPMVPIVIAGLTTGSNEQRENAAYAIGDLVTRTEENALKPYVVQLTGPLIRVAAQATAYPPGVKGAILSALATMLDTIPTFVKPFFPQLQRTFVKATADPSSLAVRNRAASALGSLMKSQPRVDPVVTELIAGARSSEEAIAASHVNALANVVKSAGQNLGEKAREACVELVADAFKDPRDDHYAQAAAALFAALAQFPDLLKPLVNSYLFAGTPPTIMTSQAILATLSSDEGDGRPSESNLFSTLGVLPGVAQKIQESIGSDRASVARTAREAKELLVALDAYNR